MRNNNLYVVITIAEAGKYLAYVKKIPQSSNLLSALSIQGIHTATACNTKKEAEEIAGTWNEAYIRNDTYLYNTQSSARPVMVI